jgi:hypothetical protein
LQKYVFQVFNAGIEQKNPWQDCSCELLAFLTPITNAPGGSQTQLKARNKTKKNYFFLKMILWGQS